MVKGNLKFFLYYVLPAATVWCLYLQSLSFDYIWDDFQYILNNPLISVGGDLSEIWFTTKSVDFWPVSYTYFWLIKNIFGAAPFWFHFFNILIFSLSVVLLFHLLRLLKIPGAIFLALVFAVHPMNVGAVAWVFQAKTNLANVFGLLSCISFFHFLRNYKYSFYFMTCMFMIFSYMSKITLIGLPVLFLIYMIKNTPVNFIKYFKVLAPLSIITFVFGIINVFWDRNALPTPDSEIILENGLVFRLLLVGKNFFFYLKQTFFPTELMFVHPRLGPSLSNFLDYGPFICLVIFLSISVILLFKSSTKNSKICASVLVSFFILFPVLGFSEIYYMRFSYVAEHYLHLAMIGFLAPAVAYLSTKKIGKFVICFYILACVYQTIRYLPYYENEKKLMEMTIQRNPYSILPHNILGLLYKNEKNTEKAMFHYNASIDVKPNATAYFNKASLFEILGDLQQAKVNYEKSIELNPYYANSYNSLAVVCVKLGEPALAEAYFKKAILTDNGDAKFYYNLGYFFEGTKRYSEALQAYTDALMLQPHNLLFKKAVERVSNQNR